MQRVILHNIRSAHNVGSIFRTADGAGVAHIYLSGYTPRPTDRFGRIQSEIAKTSLGASASVPWSAVEMIEDTIESLRTDGWHIVAVEQSPAAVPLHGFIPPAQTVFIFGNETEGIEQSVLDAVDTIVEIPMRGSKESLNVSVAAGIALFHTQS